MENQQPPTKEWYKGWGVIIAILIWPIFLLWYMWAKTNWSKKTKLAITAVVVILAIIINSKTNVDLSFYTQQSSAPARQVESKKDEQPQPLVQSETSKQIESVVAQAEKEDGTKQKKQDDIRESYDLSKTIINRIIEFNGTIYLADKYPKNQQIYDALKSEEDFYKKRSGEIMLFKSSVPSYMEEFEEEMKKAYDEIADALIINENISKYLAEYVRTANMEYRRKAQMEIDKKSLSRATLATNRFISIAGKVGLDSDAMKKEIDEIILNSVK